MLQLLLMLIGACAISLWVTRVVRDTAVGRGLLDVISSSRKVHSHPVPRLGGVGIVAGAYGALLLGLFVPDVRTTLSADGWRLFGLGMAGLVVAAVGAWDDVHGLRAREKLAAQMGVALVLYTFGFRIEEVGIPFGEPIVLGPLSLPVTLFWIAGVANALNLIDGLDGLAGGIALTGTLVVLALGAKGGDLPSVLVAVALAGGVLGFLFYNVNPASIFMGDGGSLFLGTVLAALAIRPQAHAAHEMSLLAMALALGVPIADTLAAMIRRAARGMPMSSADREHLHHRLLDIGLPHSRAVLALWAATALLAASGVYVACGSSGRGPVLVLVLSAGLVVLYKLGIIRAGSPELLARRQRNRHRLRAVRLLLDRLRRAASVADVRKDIGLAAPAIEAQSISLRPSVEHGELQHGCERAAQFPIDSGHPERGTLEVMWNERRAPLDRDTEVAIEILCQGVSAALRRIERRAAPATSASAVEHVHP
jgi:UDP-GlcNAc:undecaprenyl-phosphate/decaprenyl-phosphate GlcNAc-1-phosphate transferase